MSYRKSVLSAAIVTCLGMASQVHAQEQATTQQEATDLDKVVVVGIRGSMEKSLDTKREANSHVEVVTAEDIGKLPARNVADTLQRLPGVNISSSSANEGGFDESDRVSLRGTSPSLTQTLVNGHTIGTADWFILSQIETVGRSVSYSLLPSELVSQVVVNKSSLASLPEGGATGTVNIITRKPLDFPDQFTAEASVGGVYADGPSKTSPQFSGLFNWKNDAGSFGVMAQAFYQERELRRDGQEIVGGFSRIAEDAPVVATNPDLAGVLYPNLPGAAYFTQTRERKGGLIELQAKPSDTLTLGLSAFISDMEASNYNRNYMLWTGNFVNTQAPNPGYVIENNTLVRADYTGVAGTGYGIYDMISRPKSSSKAHYVTFDADWAASENLDVKFQVGTTEGKGETATQNIAEVVTGMGGGGGWTLNGTGRPVDWYLGGDNSQPTTEGFGTWGIQYYGVEDKENWFSADAQLFIDKGAFSSLQFGARYADHSREVKSPYGSDPGDIAGALAGAPVGYYPSDFGHGIGGTYPTNIWYFTQDALSDAVNGNSTVRHDGARHNYGSEFKIDEQSSAVYAQANFVGDQWSGNVGLRYVDITQKIRYYQSIAASSPVTPDVTSLFGNFLRMSAKNSPSRLLPSANLKFNLSEDLLFRFAASQTQTLPDYSALSGSYSVSNLTHTGNAGNPGLDPIIATNFDAALEWYFAPRALLSFGVFSIDLKNYVKFGTTTQELLNDQNGQYELYEVVAPINTNGKVKGFEVAYEQPIGDYFGINANYTYADGEADGGEDLVGTSKDTYNVSGYFENDRFSARLSYTFRSSFYHGMLRAGQYYQDDTDNLAASVSYKATDWLSVSLDALNLNNPKLKYYQANGQPQAFYSNGRQYYLNFRFKF
jgi:iron complex outermembrane recepter protein